MVLKILYKGGGLSRAESVRPREERETLGENGFSASPTWQNPFFTGSLSLSTLSPLPPPASLRQQDHSRYHIFPLDGQPFDPGNFYNLCTFGALVLTHKKLGLVDPTLRESWEGRCLPTQKRDAQRTRLLSLHKFFSHSSEEGHQSSSHSSEQSLLWGLLPSGASRK